MTLTRYIFILLLTLGGLASLQSCQEETIDYPDYTRSGEDVTLTVPVSFPKMDVRSRADLDAASLNQVNSLWVRTYSAESGKATSDWIKVEEMEDSDLPTADTEVSSTVSFKSKSGRSYIVAVANVEKSGVTRTDLTPHPISELLEEADTWNDFLDIAVVTPSNQENVRAPQPPLVMVGCYSDLIVGGPHPEPTRLDEWQNRDFQDYFIPAQKDPVRFEGAIHMRRLVSHINFNIIPGDNVEVTVNSYRVMNAPTYSWLYERPAENGMITNFGDQAADEEEALLYYKDVPQYGSQFITEDPDGKSHFDFWQGENKHIGTATNYNQREAYTQEEDKPRLFTSLLTGNIWTPNNEASYVLISCTINYKNNIQVNEQGVITTDGKEVIRTGEATYLIHLGYLNNEASDFNCFRNVNYTYNLTVNGVDDIRVDAYANPEIYNGEEGMVVDLDNATIDIDAHYAAFNIRLRPEELRDHNFGFMIIAYENGNQYTITDANEQRVEGVTTSILDKNGNIIDPKYYNWIELRATTGQEVLAQYTPRFNYNYANNEKRTFLLTDLRGNETEGPWVNMSPNQRSDSEWYTVFVNEYTYEPMYTGTNGYADEEWNGQGRPNWMGYVNQNPRRFYIRTTQKESPDGNSVYARSKYGISQQSMMSYYSVENIMANGTAIGVERENETLGMNLRHTFDGGTSTSNGRWNTAMWLNGSSTATTNLSINRTENNRPQWTNYIDINEALSVPEVAEARLQGGPPIPAKNTAIQRPKKASGGSTGATATNTYTYSDPQPSADYNIESINACISRNRDNNGNGRIEPDELRWYVPAMDQYLHMMLGSSSLPEPMIDYLSITTLPHRATNNNQWTTGNNYVVKNDYCSRYMYVSSNNNNSVMWTMEGTSTSSYNDAFGWSDDASYPWMIRCIRNLGTDMRDVSNDNKVQPAFVHNTATRTFAMTYYDLKSIRTNAYTGNGTGAGQMPVHTIPEEENSTYYGFQYAATNLTVEAMNRPSTANEQTFYNQYGRLATYINGNPCGTQGTGWRVPNQEELTIMRNAGVFSGSGYVYSDMWMSCTVNYFDRTTGAGSTSINNKLYLVINPGNGTQGTYDNFERAGARVYIRCVRDVIP